MITTLIFIVMVILGIILINSFIDIGWVITPIGFIGLVISLILIVVMHVGVDNTIQKNKIQYEGLCKRYEVIKSEYEDVSKSDVIADITEWNKNVYNTKYWTYSPLTSWFNSKEVADNLEYISLD